MKNKFVKFLAVAVLAATTAFGLAACQKTPEVPTVVVEKMATNGTYYAEGVEFTNVGNMFSLTVGNNTYTGTIVKDGDALTFEFDDATVNATATITSSGLSFTIEGANYSLIKKVNYTVAFDTDGGSAVSNETVLNGAAAVRPVNPTKEGSIFVGWYKDAEYTTPYDFAEAVTANTTVYARFVTAYTSGVEYLVSLVDGNAEYTTANTLGGALYNLPTPTQEGKTFVGWWYSDTNSADALTAQYVDGTPLTSDTTLFAVWNEGTPVVSITDTQITWTSLGKNVTYDVEITRPDGTKEVNQVQATSIEYDFATKAEGVYTVKVSANGVSGTAKLTNKQLAAVSEYVIQDGVFYFTAVDGATSYSIQVEDASGVSDIISLGQVTAFDFSEYTLGAEGIKFTVYAECEGYLTSTFTTTYNKKLAQVTGLNFDPETDKLSWNAVFGAQYYEVVIEYNDAEGESVTKTYYLTGTSYTFNNFTGDIKVSVTPVAYGVNSPAAVSVEKTKATLPTPQSPRLTYHDPEDEEYNEDALNYYVWKAVAGATGYIVKINGTAYEVEGTEFTVLPAHLTTGTDEYTFTVQAVAKDEDGNTVKLSNVSKEIKAYTYWTGNVWYEDGVIYWDYYLGTEMYAIRINNGSMVWASKGANYLTARYWSNGTECYQDGFNLIEVTYYVGTTSQTTYYSGVEVYMNRIYYMSDAFTKLGSELWAAGDTVDLYAATKGGYSLAGWYAEPDGKATGAEKYLDTYTMPAKSVIMYAAWDANIYNVTLYSDPELGTVNGTDTELELTFGSSFTLPTATVSTGTLVFAGWYSQPNGAGVRYTDENGNSLVDYDIAKDATFYAYYPTILSYKATTNKAGEVSYAVSQAPGISFVTEVTIPVEYNGYPVSEVTDFKSCTTLVKIRIPDTIEVVNYSMGFTSSTKLEAIEIYQAYEGGKKPGAENPYETYYTSEDGVLYYNNQVNEVAGWQLVYVPYAHTTAVDIMVGTVSIAYIGQVWRANAVTIPYTVKEIQTEAFKSSTLIKSITFLPTPEKDAEGNDITAENPLSIGKNAFLSCTGLTTITLPKRLAEIDTTLFDSCTALTAINVEDGGKKYASVLGVISNDLKTELIYAPKGISGVYEIPLGVKKVNNAAFISCTKLTGIVIPNWVTEIGVEAFKGCTGVKSLEFQGTEDDPTLTIKERAFYGITPLEEVTLSENVRIVKANAFGGITKLVTVNVLSSGSALQFASAITGTYSTSATSTSTSYVTTVNIGPLVGEFDIVGSFGGTNDKLAVININAANTNYTVEDGVLYNKDKSTVIFFPKVYEGEEAYTLPSTVTKIGGGAFNKRTNITSITINKNVTEIGDFAFYYCTSLTSVTFETRTADDAKLTIGKSAFYYCTGLTEFVLPLGTTEIGEYALGYLRGVSEIAIPEGVTKIGVKAFYYDDKLTSITLPSTIAELGQFGQEVNGKEVRTVDVFEGCSLLSEVNVTAGSKAFASSEGILYAANADAKAEVLIYCPAYKGGDIVIPSTVKEIAASAFYGNKAIKSVTFKDGKSAVYTDEGVEKQGTLTVGDHAFYNCSSLTKLRLPNLKYVTNYMLYGCSSLDDFVVPNTLEAFGYPYTDPTTNDTHILSAYYGFYGTSSLTTLVFEEGGTAELIIPDAVKETETLTGGKVSKVTYSNAGSYSTFYMTYFENLVLPERLTLIGSYAFYRSSSSTVLQSVTFPKSLVTIGNNAFYYNAGIKSVTFPEDSELTTIGYYAFYYAKGLETVTLPAGLKTIGLVTSWYTSLTATSNGYSFYYAQGLKSINIPDTVTYIGNYSFYQCSNLETVTIGENSQLETLGTYAFAYCKKLTSIYIPSKLKAISASTFYQDSALTTVTFANESACAKIDTNAFAYTAIEEFKFPTYVVPAASGTTVGTLTVGSGVFLNCTSLKKVTLSASIATFPTGLFTGCDSLETIEIDPNSKTLKLDSTGCYIMSVDGTSIFYCVDVPADGTAVIPEGVTTIGTYAFANNKKLKAITIPNTVTAIGGYAFSHCEALESLTFEPGVGTTGANTGVFKWNNTANASGAGQLGWHAFEYCYALTSVALPAQMQQIPQYCFYHCENLKELTWPTYKPSAYSASAYGVQVGNYAFAYCGFESMTIPENVTEWGIYVFGYNKQLKTAVVNSRFTNGSVGTAAASAGNVAGTTNTVSAVKGWNGYLFAYCTALESADFSNIQGLKTTTKSYLPTYCFSGCTSLTEVKLPSTLQATGTYVFYNCSSLKDITLPANLEYISSATFYGCTSLAEVTIPSKVKAVGSYAFRGTKISDATLPATCTIVGMYAYYGTKVTEVTLSSKIIYGYYAFAMCTSLTKVTVQEGLSYLPSYMFDGCTRLEEVTLPSTMANIGRYNSALGTAYWSTTASYNYSYGYVFRNCSSLKTVTFTPKADGTYALVNIAAYSFQGCSSLESINIPNSLQVLGQYAFDKTGLKEVTVPASISYVGTYAFANSPALEKVTFEESDNASLLTVPTYAFYKDTALKEVKLSSAIKSIDTYAFAYCSGLESFDFGGNLKVICNYAFEYSGLKSVTLPGNIQFIGGTTTYTAPVFAGKAATAAASVTPVTVTTPGSVTYTEPADTATSYAFAYCDKLESVVVEDGLTTIQGDAFYKDTALKTVTLADSVTTIGTSAFNACTSLTTVSAPKANSLGNSAFLGCTSLKTIDLSAVSNLGTSVFKQSGLVNVTLSEDINSIPASTFADCADLESVTVTSTQFTSIGTSAFANCDKLAGFTIPATTTVIDDNAFNGCTALTSATLPQTLKTLGDYAFKGTSITKVTIPAATETIGLNPFANCAQLTELKCSADNATYKTVDNVLYTQNNELVAVMPTKTGEFIVPEGVAILKGSFSGSALSKIVLPEGYTAIDTYTFAYMPNLETIVQTTPITSIAAYAFAESPKLTSFDISSVKTLKSYAFGYSYINNIVVPEELTLPTYAFAYSYADTITFAADEVALPSGTFAYTTNIKEYTFTGKFTSVGSYVFRDSALEKVTICADTKLENYALAYTTNLDTIIMEEGVTSEMLGSYTFYYGGKMSNITWASTLKCLPYYCFAYSAIESIEIPDTVVYLTSVSTTGLEPTSATYTGYTFYNCTSLKSVVLGANVMRIPTYCFRGCTALETVEFKGKLDPYYFITSYAFYDCTSIKNLYVPVRTGASTDYPTYVGAYTSTYVFGNWTEEQTVYLSLEVSDFNSATYSNYLTNTTYVGGANVVFGYDADDTTPKTATSTVVSGSKVYYVERTTVSKKVTAVKYYLVDVAAGTLTEVTVQLLLSADGKTFVELIDGEIVYAVCDGAVVENVSDISYNAKTGTYSYETAEVLYTIAVVDGVLVVTKA